MAEKLRGYWGTRPVEIDAGVNQRLREADVARRVVVDPYGSMSTVYENWKLQNRRRYEGNGYEAFVQKADGRLIELMQLVPVDIVRDVIPMSDWRQIHQSLGLKVPVQYRALGGPPANARVTP